MDFSKNYFTSKVENANIFTILQKFFVCQRFVDSMEPSRVDLIKK